MARGKKKENLTPEERLQAAIVARSEQPYNVPENWCWVTQSSIATFLNGRAYKQAELLEDCSNTPVLRVGNLFTNSSWYYSDLKLDTNKYINKGDLIYAWSASFGPFIWDGDKVIYHYHIWKILPSSAINKKYMYFWLLHDTERLKQRGHGTGMIHITKAMMESACIPLPPFHEQQRIVDRIESLFSKLDEAKKKVQDAKDSFETCKAAILHKAFIGKLTAQWRKEQGVELEGWSEDTLGKYTDLQYGYTESASQEQVGPKFLRITDIQNGTVNWDNVPFCKIDDSAYEKYAVSKNDIVIARTGATTGKSYLIVDDVKAVFASYLIRIKIKSAKLLPQYLYHFMQSQMYWNQITEYSSGIAQPGVNAKKLKKIVLPIPSVDEQTEIVRILYEFLRKERQANEATERVVKQIDLIKKSILTRAFRGELGTNDPREESSVELLKRSFSETINNEEVTPKQVIKSKAKEIFMPKTITEALLKGVRLTPEQLKNETKLSIDDFYAQLKELIDNGKIVENRENGESYLEAANENRQIENHQF